MKENAADIFEGVEAQDTNSTFEIYRAHSELASRLHVHINEAVKIYDKEGSLSELSANLQIANDDLEVMYEMVSDAVKIILTQNGEAHLSPTDRFNEAAALLCDDRLSRLNIFMTALGLGKLQEISGYQADIISLCHEYEDDFELDMDDLHIELTAQHLDIMKRDYPEFVKSLMTRDLIYWTFQQWLADEGNG